MSARSKDSKKVTKESLSKVLSERIKGLEQCIVVDTSGGCGSAFELYLVTKAFDGVALLERHRMVQGLLKEEMKVFYNSYSRERLEVKFRVDGKNLGSRTDRERCFE
eukprot:127666-Amorphochlora_amoeboformis.AAC.1